jgi:drug/metabolite transporter (DMT)-like permease
MTLLLKQPLPMPQVFSMFDWLLLIIIALMLISATIFVQYGVTKITATRASVIFLFELVVAAVAAYYLAGEVMQWNEWLGGALIILASLLSANQSQSD